MPDKKLTDAEIVKALVCCSVQGHFVCDECPAWVDSHCIGTHKQTLDLINRLQEKTQNLEIELKAMRGAANSYKAENERLKPFEDKFAEFKVHIRVEDMLVSASSLGEWLEFCDNLKAEAYNEFAEWLYSLFPTENSEIVVISRTGIAKKVNELLDKGSD